MTDAIVITGAASGLGLAMTGEFLARGETVAAVCRHVSDPLHALKDACRAGGRLYLYEQDLNDRDAVAGLMHTIEATTPCRALINNAACAFDGLTAAISPSEMEEMLSVNLLAPMLLCRAAAMHMIQRRRGAIINITSAAAHRALPGLSVYGATKAALEHFSKTLAREIGARGIRVNCVAPGFLDTQMSASLSGFQRSQISRRTPLPAETTIQDVCMAVVFLLSDAAKQITGQILCIDGGFTL